MLKVVFRFKDVLVLCCSGMMMQYGQDEKGEWLKIIYYDEDGVDVSECFCLYMFVQCIVFEQLFICLYICMFGVFLCWIMVVDIVVQQVLLWYFDFVVVWMKGQYWQVCEKVFDYEGCFC